MPTSCNLIIINRDHIEYQNSASKKLVDIQVCDVDHNRLPLRAVMLAHTVIVHDNTHFKYLKNITQPDDDMTYPMDMIGNHLDGLFVNAGVALNH